MPLWSTADENLQTALSTSQRIGDPVKAVRKRLTYANVMSSIAVFLVLGGATAVAANQLAKNSVGSKQLKKNAVTAAKLKKNAVTGAKIKPGAVTGVKIDEGTLGTVPNAASANSANVAASLSGYSHKFLRLTPTPVADYTAGVNSAAETEMFSAGPLSVVAKCFSYGTSIYGMFLIKSSVDGAIFDSYADYTYGANFLGPNRPANERELFYYSTGSDSAYTESSSPSFFAVAPGDVAISGDLQIAVKKGTLAGSQGVYGPGDTCLMTGKMFTL
jgi:hypothetical protein